MSDMIEGTGVDIRSIFSAYLDCPHKALLEIKGQAGQTDAREFSISRRLASYRETVLQRYLQSVAESRRSGVKWIGFNRGPAGEQLLATAVAANSGIITESQGNGVDHVPLLFFPVEKISKQHKLFLAFSAHTLSKAGHKVSPHGKIIHGHDGRTARVQLNKLYREMEKALDTIKRITDATYSPPLILNAHCKVCKFSDHCRAKAVEKDDLSLIPGISKKEILKLQKKGIFSVTQLSHTYRPRRRRHKAKTPEKHNHALKALAIREKKVYVTRTDVPNLGRVQIYFDVEGLPERDFYYLIGVKATDGTKEIRRSFWADSPADEARMWKDFLTLLSSFDNFSLLHFGGYESEFVARMLKRYGAIPEITPNRLKSVSINVLTICHLNVYFPTYSNSLKELAAYLGFQWSQPGSSGLDSIEWRNQWEQSGDDALKQRLLTYNLDDCEALSRLFRAIIDILGRGNSHNDAVVSTDSIKIDNPYRLGRNSFAIPDFAYVNKCAYFDYQRAKVYWRTDDNLKRSLRRKKRQDGRSPRINKVISFKRPKNCPLCRSRKIEKLYRAGRITYDLRFNASGVRRWITKHSVYRFRCRKCRGNFFPGDYILELVKSKGYSRLTTEDIPALRANFSANVYKNRNKYGHGLLSWVIYQYIGQRQSQHGITQGIKDIFGFGGFSHTVVAELKYRAAEFYQDTYDEIKKSLQSGRLIHVDETRANVKGMTGYVWVFTNLEEVLYIYADSREGEILGEVLKDFRGVLVTDFYTAYDSVPCSQQRCLIHLIRDFNDDLFKNPFDAEFKEMVESFGRLVKPIIATIDARGLKSHFLRKHKRDVFTFFKSHFERDYSSDLARKYQTRLKKNQDRLFTFLDHDGVPWNNNNAENAIKGFATMRRVIGGSSTESGLKDTLKLLSIAQTLRNKNISFLDFLKSGDKSLSSHVGQSSSKLNSTVTEKDDDRNETTGERLLEISARKTEGPQAPCPVPC